MIPLWEEAADEGLAVLEAQKAFILKQRAEGAPVADTYRKAGISPATLGVPKGRLYINRKKKFVDDAPPEMRRSGC